MPPLFYPGHTMRLFILLFLFLFSSNVFAGWDFKYSLAVRDTRSCSSLLSHGSVPDNSYVTAKYVFYCDTSYDDGTGVSGNVASFSTFDSLPLDGLFHPDYPPVGPVYGVSYTDEQCQAAYSGLPFGNGGVSRIHGATVQTAMAGITQGSCIFTANPDDLECYNNSGFKFCYSDWFLSSSGDVNTVDSPGENVDSEVPQHLEPTSDPSSCASGSIAYDGQSYCYVGGAGDDLSHWDSDTGTVQPGPVGDIPPPSATDTDGDGIPDVNDPTPGTGDTVGGGSDGSGGTTTEPGGDYGSGGQFGDSGGSQGDGDGDGTDDGACTVFLGDAVCDWMFGVPTEPVQPALPVESVDADDLAVDFNSGLSTTASCPPPETVNVAFGDFSKLVEIPYTNICLFAEMIRGLVIAAAYMSAAFITYRGVIA